MTPSWPRAGAEDLPHARFKHIAEDFVVHEQLAQDQFGEGEHLYLFIEKRLRTTREVAVALAGHFGRAPGEVGYAGMKDRFAVTRQWFSVPVPGDPAELMADIPADLCAGEVRPLDARRGPRKLRRGQLVANQFRIVLRNLDEAARSRVLNAPLPKRVPNYFGAQRFGGDNLCAATRWLEHRRRRRVSAFRKGLYLSVLRSWLFNEVLAARVRLGSWAEVLEGDCLADGFATGPLWGRGRSESQGEALEIERQALEAHAELCEGLEYAGVDQARRPFVLQPDWMAVTAEADSLVLEFSLPPGSYATTVLAEMFDLTDGSQDE